VVVDDAGTAQYSIAVDGDEVFVPRGCPALAHVINTDGGSIRELPTDTQCLRGAALIGRRFLSLNLAGPELFSVPRDGSEKVMVLTTVPISGADAWDGNLVVDHQRAYWTMSTPASVWFVQVPETGAAASPTPLAASADAGLTGVETVDTPTAIAVDANHVYWADNTACVIKRRALSTLGQPASAETFVQSECATAIVLDDKRVYWAAGADLKSFAKDKSGVVTTLAHPSEKVWSMVVDDQFLYWGEVRWYFMGTIGRVLKDGSGGAIDLVTGQQAPFALAQDCHAVYWTTTDSLVMKVAK